MERLEPVLNKLPSDIRNAILSLNYGVLEALEEIRLRSSGSLTAISAGQRFGLESRLDRQVGSNVIKEILDSLLDYSYYSFEEDIARGFITIEGGNRVGICGRAVVEDGKTIMMRDISSLNIRCAREIKGTADRLRNEIYDGKAIRNVVIISPPGCGKTTLLRDISRMLSYDGHNVSICDERSEIAGMYRGRPCYDIGASCDVLDGCPKATGIMMLIRSMAPHAIITDELGKDEDADAVKTAIAAGVSVIASVHGETREDIRNSPVGVLLRNKLFSRAIILTGRPRPGTLKEIVNI